MLINTILIKNGISKYRIAKETDLPYMTVNDIVNGVTPVDHCESGKLYKICLDIGASVDDVLRFEYERYHLRLPESLRPYFWDTDMDKLSIKENRDFIISRLITKAGTKGLETILYLYTPAEIKQAVMRTRNLTPVTAAYFRRKFRLKESDMNYYRMGADKGWR